MEQREKRKHLEREYSPPAVKKPRDLQKRESPPGSALDDKILVQEEEDPSGKLQCYTRDSSVCTPYDVDFQLLQQDVPEPCEVVEIETCSQAPGDSDSSSKPVSSSSTSRNSNEEEMHQSQKEDLGVRPSDKPLPQDVGQKSSTTWNDMCFHVHLANEPCSDELHMRKERAMKIYYMYVKRQREANTVYNTQEGLLPPKKRARVQELSCIGKVPSEASSSSVITEDMIIDNEASCDTSDEDDFESEGPAELLALEEKPRIKTPEWLLWPEHGFQCMACCRVFPSLDILEEHVKNGVKEGFSCRIFHLAFAWMKSKKE
ncbi:protein FAM170A-like [Ochotona curzoniae]|uniref:protein FAM170A-like n=1 Tax=Ochotona curzoniae TaxID=130825 RepID=UPI001B34EC88|nr:protein FAM170A-like [Ochotona curzoniae]